jgi:hypothetical protein
MNGVMALRMISLASLSLCIAALPTILNASAPTPCGGGENPRFGYIQNKYGEYLQCYDSHCVFQTEKGQKFKETAGKDQQCSYVIFEDGATTGNCLDRSSCHHSSSAARIADCSDCGAIHWGYNPVTGALSEDKGSNCLQNDGTIEHCKDDHAIVKFINPPEECISNIHEPQSRWVPVATSDSPNVDISYHTGSTSSDSHTRSTKWAYKVGAKVSTGFKVFGHGFDLEVESSMSQEFASEATNAFSQTEDRTVVYHAVNAGVYWQFFWDVTDECGVTQAKEFNLVATPSKVAPPCCLPGYASDPSDYTKPCLKDWSGNLVDLCNRTITLIRNVTRAQDLAVVEAAK